MWQNATSHDRPHPHDTRCPAYAWRAYRGYGGGGGGMDCDAEGVTRAGALTGFRVSRRVTSRAADTLVPVVSIPRVPIFIPHFACERKGNMAYSVGCGGTMCGR